MPMVFAAIAKGDANHGGGDTALLLSPLCMVRIFGFGSWLGEVNIGEVGIGLDKLLKVFVSVHKGMDETR